MNKPKFFIFTVIFLLGLTSVFAQTEEQNQVEPSYEVLLHVIVGSNQTGAKSSLPPALSNVAKKLKGEYTFADYKLAATFLERIAVNGSVEHKAILNQLNQSQEKESYFTDWVLGGLKTATGTGGEKLVQFQSFRFGARVPIVVQTVRDEKGDASRNIVNYEPIGVSVNRFNVPENEPTIIGSLATPKTDEFIFLVLTVKPTE